MERGGLHQVRKAGLGGTYRHGHGIGLEGHEPPWISEDDNTVLRKDMMSPCEPGVDDVASRGFPHSDRVVVRADRGESLSHYPTRLEESVIEI